MIKVKNNTIIKTSLPYSDKVNGRTVLNYHLLDKEILLAEGWLPVEKQEPEYNSKEETLVHDRYEIHDDKVIEYLKAIPLEPDPELAPSLEERLEALEIMELERIMGGLEW